MNEHPPNIEVECPNCGKKVITGLGANPACHTCGKPFSLKPVAVERAIAESHGPQPERSNELGLARVIVKYLHTTFSMPGRCVSAGCECADFGGAAQEVSPVGSVQKITGPERPRCPRCGAETTCLSCQQEVSPPSPKQERDQLLFALGCQLGGVKSALEVIEAKNEFIEKAEGDTRELKAALRLVTENFRQHFREGDHTLHWRDALDALAAAEKLLAG